VISGLRCGKCLAFAPSGHCDNRSEPSLMVTKRTWRERFGGSAKRISAAPLSVQSFAAMPCPEPLSEATAWLSNYRSEITNPLRSAATISPAWRPDSVRTAPFWFVSTMPPAPAPTATPTPAAP
jgi:hypothetical protein